MKQSTAPAPVRLLAGEGAEHEASERAEAVERMLAERFGGRRLTTDERVAALTSHIMTLMADRPIDEVRACLDRAESRVKFGAPSGRIIRGLIAEVRHG